MRPVFQFAEDSLSWFSSFVLNSDFASYCQLETSPGDHILVTRNSAMLTMFELHGSLNVVGKEEFKTITEGLDRALSAYMQNPGHSFQFSFERDPDAAERELRKAIQPSLDTARNLGLDAFMDILDERVRRQASMTAAEKALFVVSTNMSALSKDESKLERERKSQRMQKHNLPMAHYGQSFSAISENILHRHNSLVELMGGDLKNVGVHVTPLQAHQAVAEIKRMIYPSMTAENWRPYLAGDRIPVRLVPKKSDPSDIWLPKISNQIITHKIISQGDFVKAGDTWYASVLMELGPQDIQPFMQLFRRMGGEMPWRIMFDIAPGGLDAQTMKRTIVSVIGFFGDTNKAIKKSFMDLEERQKAGETIVSMKVCAVTWAKDKTSLERRYSMLVKAIEGWGVCGATGDVGDPQLALACSVPGYSDRNIAPPLAPPLSDAVVMLPVTRPASPWKHGAILFRSMDGKIWPHQPGSSMQDTSVNLLYAPPGSGKSVLLNVIDLGICLSPGLQNLPYLVIVDIAPSSKGLIDLLQESLPAHRKHEAGYFRLSMDGKYAVNPFDTQLGCRYPTAMERMFLINLIGLLATPAGESKPYEASDQLAGMMVDEVYKLRADRQPRRYSPGIEPSVDTRISEMRIELDRVSSWYEVADELFGAGYIHEATLAQRNAVPVLADLMEVIKLPSIRDIFAPNENSAVKISTGETLLDAMSRIISTSMREFPVISTTTKFDLGDTRVVSLDLEEVTRGGGATAEKQAAIMYMMARQMAAKNFYLKPDMLPAMLESCPVRYHAWHEARAKQIHSESKAICYDEFHRTGNMASLRAMVLTDMREGRKWNIQISLASQFLSDFDSDMVNASTSVYILHSGNAQMVQEAKERFGLSETACEQLERHVHGPGERGANFLVWYRTKVGQVVQVLNNSPGAIELWSFTTTPEDNQLKAALCQYGNPPMARRLLAKAYPKGSAKSDIEARCVNVTTEEGRESIINGIASDLWSRRDSILN